MCPSKLIQHSDALGNRRFDLLDHDIAQHPQCLVGMLVVVLLCRIYSKPSPEFPLSTSTTVAGSGTVVETVIAGLATV